jgi:para-aminobenzoate synthetase component 1
MAKSPLIPQVCLTSFDLHKTRVNDADFLRFISSNLRNKISVALVSGGEREKGRYSILGLDPVAIFRSKGNNISIETSAGMESWELPPLEALDRFHSISCSPFPMLNRPFCGGILGYISYDLKNQIENLPETVKDSNNLPDIFQIIPSLVLIHDRQEESMTKLTFSFCNQGYATIGGQKLPDEELLSGELLSDFSFEEYLETVEKIRTYIRNGDVYQVNLSQRFSTSFSGNPVELFTDLLQANPASYFAYVNAGDHQVISTSPERFLMRRGQEIESRPIKGTRKRGTSPEEDARLKQELQDSKKDDAELSMIVDLIRNDLGRICEVGSVTVENHKNVEAYQNVFHLDSTVKGKLLKDIKVSQIIESTFPGGSITGCPKIRAMEIIDELEKHARHVYTGAIGYLGWHNNLDLNIAIRTAVICKGRISVNSGGGIVYDSDPELEFEETLHKAKTFFDVMNRGE